MQSQRRNKLEVTIPLLSTCALLALTLALLWALSAANVGLARGSGGGTASGTAGQGTGPAMDATTGSRPHLASESNTGRVAAAGPANATRKSDEEDGVDDKIDAAKPSEPVQPPQSPMLSDVRRPLRSGATGGNGAGNVFEKEGTDTKFVYVVDRSGSMSSGRLDAAKRELIETIQNLPAHAEFQVIFYSDQPMGMHVNGLLTATPDHKKETIAWIESVPAGGGTAPAAAMQQALAFSPQTVWLLSDGAFDLTVCDVIRKANPGQSIAINTIAFHDPSGESVLRRIAAENRGDYRYVPP